MNMELRRPKRLKDYWTWQTNSNMLENSLCIFLPHRVWKHEYPDDDDNSTRDIV